MPSEDRSWLESLKHYVSAPRRAFESLQRPIDDKEYPTEYTTASPLVNITRGDIDKATEAAMAVSGGGLSTKPIRAYHSSPHDFERFDLSKIGTGEGAQVYGHGLYFAENPAVSGQGGQYWNQFLPRFQGNERSAASRLWASNFDRDAATQTAQRVLDDTKEALRTGVYPEPAKYGPSRDKYEAMARQQQQQLDMLKSGKPVGPRTYEVNINADPTHMLNWDKPLRDQPHIQDVLAERMLSQLPGKAGVRALRAVNEEVDALGGKAGDILYRNFSTKPREASAILNEAGIPGIRYLDQGSRGAGTGLSNYVVFNPSIIDIVKKYGLAGLAAPPAIAGAMNRENQP